MQMTRYPHWGAHSGIHQFASRLDPGAFAYELHKAHDGDDDFRLGSWRMRERLRPLVQRRGMGWYKLSDLVGEARALKACALGRTDIVHFLDGEHGGQYLPAWLAAAPWSRARTVITYHQPPELMPGLVNPRIAARFDKVVLVSPTQRAWFEGVVRPERIVTILHGIDTGFFRPGPGAASAGAFRCVAVGHWLRDWTTIRAAAESLLSRPDIEFHIVTDRETGLEQLGNVHFHRNVDDAALVGLYQACGALFLPLTHSTANNAILEAMACGLPVISTDMESVRTYVGEGAAILLQPGDVEGAVQAIERLSADAALRARLGAGARARAEDLSWERIAAQYGALYAELAG